MSLDIKKRNTLIFAAVFICLLGVLFLKPGPEPVRLDSATVQDILSDGLTTKQRRSLEKVKAQFRKCASKCEAIKDDHVKQLKCLRACSDEHAEATLKAMR